MDVSGGARSPFSPRVRALGGNAGRRSLSLSVAKKNLNSKMNPVPRGDVILKTQANCIETYGLPLPVLVTETLSFANTKDVSVRMSPNGWCWLVYGRKLLVWPYRDGKTSACRELTLPQTDLAHKAGLVCVYYDEDSQMPSCVAASPEGVVRYWPSVAHESACTDETAELHGQECESLAEADSGTLVLATSTCTLVLLQCRQTDGRPGVNMRTLRAPGGWLGGLGRRVSLLIFGSMPAQMVETKLVGVCVLDASSAGCEEAGGPYVCCVAAGPALQLWGLAGDTLARELDLRRPLRDVYCRHQLAPPGDINTLEVFVLDMQPANNGLLLLTAAVNPTRSPEMRYALVHISLEESPRSRVTSLVALPRLSFQRDGDAEPSSLGLMETNGRVHLFNRRQLAIICNTTEKPDYVDLSSESDCILGTALCHGTPLFFTKKNGIVAVIPNELANNDGSICESPIGSPCPSDMYDGHLSLYEIDPDEISQVTNDTSGKLKTAFLYHVRRDPAACRAIIDELFPSHVQPPRSRNQSMNMSGSASFNMSDDEEADVDAALDRTVVQIAKEMLDDVPAGDPRWNATAIGEGVNIPLGSSSALRILSQLRDKQKALGLFVDFLRATGLWQRLGYISRDLALLPSSSVPGAVSTRSVVAQLCERLAAATALRRMQQGAAAHVIDTVLHQVIESSQSGGETEKGAGVSLSASDLFYKNVCGVERCVHGVVRCCEEQSGSDGLPRLVLAANRVLLGFLQEVHKCRAANQATLELNQLTSGNPGEAVTWTNALGGKSVLAALVKQQKITVNAATAVQDGTMKGQLFDQAVSLAEAILSDAAYQAKNPLTQRSYRALCTETTSHLVEVGQYERASIIAEKFKDLELLIRICVETEDGDKLNHYMDKYANEGFIEQTFAYVTERNDSKGGARALMWAGARQQGRLRAWLSAAPERRALLWAHEARAGAWHRAARALADLAAEERHRGRAAVIASLGKLAALVSSGEVQELVMPLVTQKLLLTEQHKALPRQFAAAHDTKLYTPAQLIEMYASEKSRLTEYDYKKALDLADMIEDSGERDTMRMKIWCAAIKQDNWSDYNAMDPLPDIQEKTLFKLIDLIDLLGCDGQSPPAVSRLLVSEHLGALSSDSNLQFLLQYGFEHLQSQMPV